MTAEHCRLITVKKNIKIHQSAVLKIAVTPKQYHLNQLKSNKTLNNIFFCGETMKCFPTCKQIHSEERNQVCSSLSPLLQLCPVHPFTVCSCHNCTRYRKSISNIQPFLSVSTFILLETYFIEQ